MVSYNTRLCMDATEHPQHNLQGIEDNVLYIDTFSWNILCDYCTPVNLKCIFDSILKENTYFEIFI